MFTVVIAPYSHYYGQIGEFMECQEKDLFRIKIGDKIIPMHRREISTVPDYIIKVSYNKSKNNERIYVRDKETC